MADNDRVKRENGCFADIINLWLERMGNHFSPEARIEALLLVAQDNPLPILLDHPAYWRLPPRDVFESQWAALERYLAICRDSRVLPHVVMAQVQKWAAGNYKELSKDRIAFSTLPLFL